MLLNPLALLLGKREDVFSPLMLYSSKLHDTFTLGKSKKAALHRLCADDLKKW